MCLAQVKVGKDGLCPQCREPIPRMYAQEYRQCPPVVVSAIGFRGHGKTVYLASLFYVFDELAQLWPDFYTHALDEPSLDTVYENKKRLKQGELPESTPKNFPRPTIVRARNIPRYCHRHLLFYDTGGETFERASQLVEHAHFVRRSQTVMFLVSLRDVGENPGEEMHRLFQVYVQGLTSLGGQPQQQHLVVVYTKGDDLGERLTDWYPLWSDLADGGLDRLARPQGYLRSMRQTSHLLSQLTEEQLQAHQFVNMTREFRSVEYTMVSALGTAPQDNRFDPEAKSWGVLDPLLWMMEKSLSPWQRFWRRE
jgi:hypothetical protein